jgi:RNA recognition motif-containing protein
MHISTPRSEIIRDRKTGDSLGYGFIEYEKEDDAEEAYLKVRAMLRCLLPAEDITKV